MKTTISGVEIDHAELSRLVQERVNLLRNTIESDEEGYLSVAFLLHIVDGYWELLNGDSAFDVDHRGVFGVSSFLLDESEPDSTADELISDAESQVEFFDSTEEDWREDAGLSAEPLHDKREDLDD